jgi:hypothetical protein
MVNDMISAKDSDLLNYIVAASELGKIRWQPTAGGNEFTASFKGKYNVVVGISDEPEGPYLNLKNENNQMMLFIHENDDPSGRVGRIFISARRDALDVDAAIDDIIKGE